MTNGVRRGLAYGIALAMGLAVVAWLIPADTILLPDPFRRAFGSDEAQSVIGQRYFLAEPWHWPVFLLPDLAWPGTNVAFTDSLLLALLPLKLFAPWLPRGFYLQAGWAALAFTLQPVAAVFALRGAGERRLVGSFAIAALSLCMPTLLDRYGAMSLCTHALVLGATGLYLRLAAAPSPRLWAGAWLLLLAALLVHPYLLAMVATVLAAIPATLALRGNRRWLASAAWLVGALALTAGCALTLGYGGAAPLAGFGRYSMNMLGPFAPGPSALTSYRLPDPTGGQAYEGDQYLGAGVLALGLLALVQLGRGRARLAVRRHFGLVLVLGCLTLFALSNRVYAGRHLLLAIDGVPEAIQQFRATGRFFWPVTYAILVAVTTLTLRGLPHRAACAVLLGAIALQLADTRGLWRGIATDLRSDGAWTVDPAQMRPILARYRQLTLWPAFGCGASTGGEDMRFMHMLQLASETLMRTNTMYVARTAGPPNCDPEAVLAAPWAPSELRVILPPANPGERWRVPGHCGLTGGILLCAANDPAVDALPAPPAPMLALGALIAVDAPSGRAMLGEGWSTVGADGAWSDGAEATLRFGLPAGGPPMVTVSLDVNAIAPSAQAAQTVRLSAGGVPVATWQIPDLTSATLRAQLPATPGMILRLDIAGPVRPIDRGMNADRRRLGIQLHSLRVDPA